jgi:Divergent InlB B-repeat domain
MRSRRLIAALVAVIAVGAAAPQAPSRNAASPTLYLVIAGYLASVEMSPAGTLVKDCGTYCAFVFPTGTTSVRLTARPARGTTFLGWTQAFGGWTPPCSGPARTCMVNPVSSLAVKATFSPVSLSVRTNGGGGVDFLDSRPACGSDCRLYRYGTTAHLRARPDELDVFDSWRGCRSSGPTCAVRMDSNRIVTAQFRCAGSICQTQLPVTHPTTVKVQVIGHGRVIGSQFNCPQVKCTRDNVERGTMISIQAKPDPGAQFGGWSTVAVTCSKSGERCTFPVFKDAKGNYPRLVAVFKNVPPPPPPPPPPKPPPPPPKPPPPPPPAPPPPPPPPPHPVRCRVPKLHGLRLGPAKARIRSRHCAVGRVRHRHSRPSLRGRVIGQRPRAGAVRRRGFPVKVVVGRR